MEANLLSIEKIENKGDCRIFVFGFSTATIEDNEKINKAKNNNKDYSAEEFNKLHDLYWKLIRKRLPKK